jgi:hypothetical protein
MAARLSRRICEGPLLADIVEKVENRGLRKSRECRMFVISDAARLSRIDANVAGRFCVS